MVSFPMGDFLVIFVCFLISIGVLATAILHEFYSLVSPFFFLTSTQRSFPNEIPFQLLLCCSAIGIVSNGKTASSDTRQGLDCFDGRRQHDLFAQRVLICIPTLDKHQQVVNNLIFSVSRRRVHGSRRHVYYSSWTQYGLSRFPVCETANILHYKVYSLIIFSKGERNIRL